MAGQAVSRELTGRSRRIRTRVTGTVQGVGFRPFVHRLAAELALSGYVLNDERGVLLEVEGDAAEVAGFLERLRSEAPPLATIERIAVDDVMLTGESGFVIESSRHGGEPLAIVSPDVATCEACVRELFDPTDRRHRYPFINCTDCGPRFTIVRGVPYDRPLTTMAGFEMCERCRAEYEDPTDRRFHAQPNACADCGPALRLLGADARDMQVADPLATVADAWGRGLIVAVKGLGGFHLACRADHEQAVASLRSRKHREDKPFALMAPDLEAAHALVELTKAEEALLVGRERPIVIARRRGDARVAGSVAPGSPDLGVMLPYTPLHHLLLADAGTTLVMTSANVSDEPIAYGDDDALRRLGGIADLYLMHDRPIQTRTDDSVVRSLGAVGERPLIFRRSRGYVPASLELPVASPEPLLACGAELKNTFCVAKGDRAWMSHHIGDLKNTETLLSFQDGIDHFERLFAVEPRVVAHDLHPQYLSTAYANDREGVELLGVQHHHAHLAACLAEHGSEGPALGAIFDGTGYGTDGTIWGGELLVGGLSEFTRAGRLLPVPMPGGEAAIREPWRMACSWLLAAGRADQAPQALRDRVDPARWRAVAGLARGGPVSPLTSSMGRLFDAVAALCGLRAEVTYEGQAAVELESVSDREETAAYPLSVVDSEDGVVLDPRSTVAAVAADSSAGMATPLVAARFHNAVAAATAEACVRLAQEVGLDTVVLSGGVFQNRLLLERTLPALRDAGLRALVPERLPPGDGGIAYGQAAVAAARLAGGRG
ncbi:MAG: carbamoyltransferase HypF [Actinomycetota bacterium]|nr:carbamoyltransferase HypF [Actinomycetota bacterium]